MDRRDINIVIVPNTEGSLHDCVLFMFDFYSRQGLRCFISKDVKPGMKNIINGALLYKSSPDYSSPPGIYPTPEFPSDTIIMNMEHLYDDSQWLKHPFAYKEILKKYQVYDFNVTNINYLRNLGNNNVKLIKMGYTRMLKNIPSKEKDINVLFYGGINERRRKFLDLIQKEIPGVCIYNNGLWGIDRCSVIARAKIVINIHHYNLCNFESTRVFHLLMNKKFVISEASNDDNEYKDLADGFVRTMINSPRDMVDEIKYFLREEGKREKIAEKGYQLIKKLESSYPL